MLLRSRRSCGTRQDVSLPAAILGVVLLLATSVSAQKPVAELPRVYIDTKWNLPQGGGKTWRAHTAADLSSALTDSVPGDVIVLDAGATYTGSFQIPAKANPSHKWIYVISSSLANLPAGTRVSPANIANMPTVASSNALPAFDVLAGANHWRFVGLNITETGAISNLLFGNYTSTTPLPDSITIDRCYIHGLPTASVHRAILANDTNFAIVDSYVSDVQGAGLETQGIAAWSTPGPIKMVNNYVSATTENVMFGGAGGAANPYVPSDIEIRGNYLFKPLSWVGNPIAAVKNAFELKSAQRVLFDGNTIENVWMSAQNGFAVVLTPRPSQSGDIAVVNDITITNNVLKNVVGGFNTLAKDDTCGSTAYPNCRNAGDMARVNVVNNLVTFYDATLPGGVRNSLWQISRGMDRTVTPNAQGVPHEMVFQHNTTISAASTPCWASIYFTTTAPTDAHITNNIWILDNVLCREIHGAFGGLGQTGTTGLVRYMGDPAPIDVRLAGNAMFVEPKARDLGNASNPEPATWPAHNLATTKPFVFDSNHALLTPDMSKYTSDGKQAGFIPVQVTPPRPPPPPPNPNLGRAYCDSGTTTPAHCSTWTRVM